MATRLVKGNAYVSISGLDRGKLLLAKTTLYTTQAPDLPAFPPPIIRPTLVGTDVSEVFPPTVEVTNAIPKFTLAEVERNPYRSHLSEDPDERLEDTREQQRILREQHNKTQAGDTTFDYGLLLKTYPNKEFTLGSLGRFYHEDYGLTMARFVQFRDCVDSDYQGQPVGRHKFNEDEYVSWVMTNNYEKSDADMIAGFTFFAETPADGEYGWMVVSGANPAQIRADGGTIPAQNEGYSWSAQSSIGVQKAGRTCARRWMGAANAGINPGSIYISLEGPSIMDLIGIIDTQLEPIDTRLTAAESDIDDLQSQVTDNNNSIAALVIADSVLTERIAREELLRAREIQALRNAVVTVDYEGLLETQRIQIYADFQAADEAIRVSVNSNVARITDLEVAVAAIDVTGFAGQISGLASAIGAISTQLDGIVIDWQATATAQDQVMISTSTTNTDGNLEFTFIPIDFKISELTDFWDAVPPTNGQAIVWSSAGSIWGPADVVLPGRTVTAGTGLTGGGDLSADRTISLADTSVTPGSYGDATNVAQVTVDQQGRITGVTEVAITGAGGGSSAYGYEATPADIPLIANFTWVNQGTCTASDGDKGLVIVVDTDQEIHLLTQTPPTAPYSVYMRFDVAAGRSNSNTFIDYPGIALRNSSNGRFLFCYEGRLNGADYPSGIQRWQNATTFNSEALMNTRLVERLHWLRLDVTSTTVTLQVSANGLDWLSLGSETIATYLTAAGGTADEIGIAIRAGPSSICLLTVNQFGFTAPTA